GRPAIRDRHPPRPCVVARGRPVCRRWRSPAAPWPRARSRRSRRRTRLEPDQEVTLNTLNALVI
ncbi:MAG TPA: hypothetical protein VEM58_02110, partial [Streptosporangiaceae bacterium]|nr:hypothetical protein [Streptosporangiaceae bacterium]